MGWHAEVQITSEDIPARDELVALYQSVGWSAYTADPHTLEQAACGSSYVVTARRDGVLVGLARAISDDATICYLQDVLVAPHAQRTGIGNRLAREVSRRCAGARKNVLLTEDEPGQRAFSASLGYTEIRDYGQAALRAFVRFDI